MRNEVVLKKWYGLCDNAWFPWQPIADLITCVFMNINKNAKNKGNSLKYKYTDFTAMLSLLHVLIPSMLQFDKSIHQVVLYEYCLIFIFMKIHENF